MKISLLICAAIAGSRHASAQQQDSTSFSSALRAWMSNSSGENAKVSTDSTSVSVFINGLTGGGITDEDMIVINDSLVAAYASTYAKAIGASMESFQPTTAAGGSGDDEDDDVHRLGWGRGGYNHNNPWHRKNRWWGPFADGWGCSTCPNDDDVKVVATSSLEEGSAYGSALIRGVMRTTKLTAPIVIEEATSIATVHAKFQNKFCTHLRSSDTAKFAKAKHCTVSYIKAPTQALDCGNAMVTTTAEFTIDGTLHDLSVDEIATIEESIKDAYNEAYLTTGVSMDAFQIVGEAANFEDGSSVDSKTVTGHFTPLCPNDDSDVNPPGPGKLEFIQLAMDKAVCRKLINSGKAQFANVENCTFRIKFNPATNVAAARASPDA